MIARIFRTLLILVLVLILAVAGFGFLSLQDEPIVVEQTTPTPADVSEARDFVRGVRAALSDQSAASEPFVTTQQQLNSVIKLGARFIPGFRAKIAVAGDTVVGTAAIPVPYFADDKWLNLRVVAPEFDDGLVLSEVDIGPFPLPPALALEAGRVGGNLVLGNSLGDMAVSAATAMRINDERVSFNFALGEAGSNGIMRGVFGKLRGSEMPSPEEIEVYYQRLRTAMEEGDLPKNGSYLPYLQYTLQMTLDHGGAGGIENAYTAAIFALARACGATDFARVVGGLTASSETNEDAWTVTCDDLTLNGRIDSRLHFTTAAAIQAASNRGFAVSVGEFKELYDTVKAGGFDFTDIAANNSGIRLSNRFMAAPIEDWPDLLSRIETEQDVIVAFDGIPQIMSGEEFQARFGDVDSPEYYAMLGEIEERISRLSLHQ